MNLAPELQVGCLTKARHVLVNVNSLWSLGFQTTAGPHAPMQCSRWAFALKGLRERQCHVVDAMLAVSKRCLAMCEVQQRLPGGGQSHQCRRGHSPVEGGMGRWEAPGSRAAGTY